MKTRKTREGLNVSQFSLGCMNLPNDAHEVEDIIDYALSQGVTYFDTADLYQFGKNETVLGKVLPKFQSQYGFYIGTKVGNAFDSLKEKQLGWNPTKKHIVRSIKDSFQRLKLDALDLYQLHGGTIDDNMDETIEAFETLKSDGLIREYGLSSIRLNVINYYQQHSNISTLMSPLNPIDNRALETLELLSPQIVFLARGPLMQGVFSERAESVLEDKFADGFLNYDGETLQSTIARLRERFGDLLELAYAYHKHYDTVIVNGVSSKTQLVKNLEAYHTSVVLTSEDVDALHAIVHMLKYEEHRK